MRTSVVVASVFAAALFGAQALMAHQDSGGMMGGRSMMGGGGGMMGMMQQMSQMMDTCNKMMQEHHRQVPEVQQGRDSQRQKAVKRRFGRLMQNGA